MRLGEDDSDPVSEGDALPDESAQVDEFAPTEELSGSPGRDQDKQGMMHTVMDADEQRLDTGNMVLDATNNNVSMFTPELFMQKLTQNYRSAKKLFGETIIRRISGYDSAYVEKNLNIPEFRRELEQKVKENIEGLKEDGVLAKDGSITEEAIDLAAVTLAVQELDHLQAEGVIGKRVHKHKSVTGIREEIKPFTNDPYRSVNVAQSVKVAMRRGHSKVIREDLRAHERESKGGAHIVYAIDASGSMKGEKIAQAKRAGIALAYKAIQGGDKVGLLVFGKDIQISVPPSKDFSRLLATITRVKAAAETDLAKCVRHSITMFQSQNEVNHLILLTDALPTVGEKPEDDVLGAVSEARSAKVSLSVIGIGLDEKGRELAESMVDVGLGRLLHVKNLEDMDMIVLEEYSHII